MVLALIAAGGKLTLNTFNHIFIFLQKETSLDYPVGQHSPTSDSLSQSSSPIWVLHMELLNQQSASQI